MDANFPFEFKQSTIEMLREFKINNIDTYVSYFGQTEILDLSNYDYLRLVSFVLTHLTIDARK